MNGSVVLVLCGMVDLAVGCLVVNRVLVNRLDPIGVEELALSEWGVRRYRVKGTDDFRAAVSAAGIPRLGSVHPLRIELRVVRIMSRFDPGDRTFLVTVIYEPVVTGISW